MFNDGNRSVFNLTNFRIGEKMSKAAKLYQNSDKGEEAKKEFFRALALYRAYAQFDK